METVPARAPEDAAQILVVEDNLGSGRTLVDILETEGYRIAWERDGPAALDYLRHSPAPHVILLDLLLPGMEGAEFRRQQLQDPALAAIPVVVMTGADDSVEQAFSLPVAGYFTKPYDIKALLDTIARCFPSNHAAAMSTEAREERRDSP